MQRNTKHSKKSIAKMSATTRNFWKELKENDYDRYVEVCSNMSKSAKKRRNPRRKK